MMLSLAACGGEEESSANGEGAATAEQKTIDGNVLDEEQYFNGYLGSEPTTLDSVVGNDTYSLSSDQRYGASDQTGEKDGQNVREGAGALRPGNPTRPAMSGPSICVTTPGATASL